MSYQVGKPARLQPNDPWFLTEQAAIEHANSLHAKRGKHGSDSLFETVAIWDERSSYVWLFFDGQMFRAT